MSKPPLTDDEYDALYRNPNTAVVKNLMTKYALTPQQSENSWVRFLSPTCFVIDTRKREAAVYEY